MFKQLWSMIHSTIPSSKTQYLFGVIFGMGMCGGVVGSLVPGFLAIRMGSALLLLFTLPIYGLLFWAYRKAYYLSGAQAFVSSVESRQSFGREGFLQIARNGYLMSILLLVVFMQITVALVDYQFSHQLEIAIPMQDFRTAYFGKLTSIINLVSLGFQFVGTFLMLKILGFRNSHYFVPLLLFLTTVGQLTVPGLTMAVLAYSFTKSIDYSLFGVIRELLFVPLKMDEKFRAKAVIDVFAYRTSKAFASFFLLGLQFYVGSQVFILSNYFLCVVFAAWVLVVAVLFRKFHLLQAYPQ